MFFKLLKRIKAMVTTPTQLRTAKLIMVTADNNNKFYDMAENGDGTFTVTYGRVGAAGTTQSYPTSQWDSKYYEKVRKGYKDQTALFAGEGENEMDLSDILDTVVRKLMNDLIRYARKSISYHYNVSAEQVTQRQVEEAQALLDLLVSKIQLDMDIKEFNDYLLQLYTVIPRKMKNVKEALVKSANTHEDIEIIRNKMGEEQATLDVMRSQVQLNSQQKEQNTTKENINLLQRMGLSVTLLNDKNIEDTIKNMMQDEAHRFVRAYKVSHQKTQVEFDKWLLNKTNPQTSLFWHGSRNENWLSILDTGLVLRPANAVITGKMFGYGIYFADKFRKSLNYTSLRGACWSNGSSDRAFLAVFEVHTGTQLKIQKHEPWCYQLDEGNLKKQGKDYDSLFALGGADLVNNEYIVYNQAQCTIKYLVEVKN